MKDWLNNDLNEGDLVLYSSTSSLTGMNLGVITDLRPGRIQLKLMFKTAHTWTPDGKIITLHQGRSAYKSVTRYFGTINKEDN